MSDLGRRLAAELAGAGVTQDDLRPLVERLGANADMVTQVDALLSGGFGFDFIREWAGFYCRA